MPQIIGIALLGTALYCAYRVVKREMNRVGADLDRQSAAKSDAQEGQKLVKDPETGIYRPEDRN